MPDTTARGVPASLVFAVKNNPIHIKEKPYDLMYVPEDDRPASNMRYEIKENVLVNDMRDQNLTFYDNGMAIVTLQSQLQYDGATSPFRKQQGNHYTPADVEDRMLHLFGKTFVAEVYNVHHNPSQNWYYLSDQTESEAIVFSGYDSQNSEKSKVAHCAFSLPDTKRAETPRESIEIRALAFYDV
ncbi:uncharacterized protein N7446_001366 [Penicillium canescens]|uniref:Methyltransferase n=1 Tax=Penicillium canescens TaxID=5083 RepID=A0AAD6IC51_PENCN|nr:uncharacterized protein N7446_001366 [Penicillium canescens]KAJ6043170.1 hypothetical protein N7460_004525 [Penicillium canescens]KAJ6054645.1 hypothetical protein N7444_003743 [Penicillium canescens]KAJ6073589.1 hypothetical protein N7446_001366 [Penicillium canescens]